MRPILLIISLFVLIISNHTYAQNNNLSVTGHVFDSQTGYPIENHTIILNISGNGLIDTYGFYSDNQGFWGSDSLLGYNQGTVHAFTYDCNGQVHEFQESYSPGLTTFVFDFNICNDSVSGDDCENWFLAEQITANTFNFHGESSPFPAEVYNWNFGDGQSGLGQDIVHIFEPGSGNEFLVTLTTFSYNPASGDSCLAISQQLVNLGDTTNCQADYYFLPDSIEPLMVHFFDNSTGNITSRLWDFGDGNNSVDFNPVHSFAEPGYYITCLTISSDSLGVYCTDTYCAEIIVQAGLISEFSFVLDTLSGMAGNYFFTDNSSGEPEIWLWDFGDGNTLNIQNPAHQFAETGVFNVCLQVTKNLPNGGYLSDTYCEEITTPLYFDIGGLAFIGNTPINNPISTGDTGVAYLYRKYEDAVVAVDTNFFYEYGYYWFSNVREGNHLVKVGLTENSQNFAGYAPAYYPDQIYWQDAEILLVKDSNNYFANVYLSPLSGTSAGAGSIDGYIIDTQNPSMSEYISGQPVFLYNSSNELLTFNISGLFSNFFFSNLAFGTYELRTDVTGFFGNPVIITIDGNNPSLYNILLEIYKYDPNAVHENNDYTFNTGPVYPNPLTDQLNLEVISDSDVKLNGGIYNLSGIKILEVEFNVKSGANSLTISTKNLESGLYFFTIGSNSMQKSKTFKFLKK